MKKFNSAKLTLTILGIMTAVCVYGSIGSTLAWYAYSTRALVSYSGTSVSETALLQIGICSDVALDDMPSSISEVTYQGDANRYYFSNSGRGLTYDVISKYLSKKGYAINSLSPTTSGSYKYGDDENDFLLKQSPNEVVHGNDTVAEKKDFVTVPFVFRVQGEGQNVYLDNVEIWLSKALAKASSHNDGEIYKAIRIFVDRDGRNYGGWREVTDLAKGGSAPDGNLGHPYYYDIVANKLYARIGNNWNELANVTVSDNEPNLDNFEIGNFYINTAEEKVYVKAASDFIVNPSANEKGKTRVGGLLNISRNQYYDYDENGEVLYGEYEPGALNLLSQNGYSGDNTVVDVNGVGSNTPSTFVAKHYPGVNYYSDFTGANDALFKHAEYESISSIAPSRDNHDYLSNADALNPTSVCITRSDDHYLARVNMTVYLEGWDFSVVDKEESHRFDLGLTFEMSRL